MEVKRLQEEDLRQCFQRDVAAWGLTKEGTDSKNDKMMNVGPKQ